jgi:hypothetical protein
MKHATALLIAVVLGVAPATAQTAASSVRAAFLYNFAKFTTWPEDALPARQRLSLCVVGDTAVADALEQAIRGRAAAGHELSVEVIKPEGDVRSCHLLYVGARESHRAVEMIAAVKGAPVLTVSEANGFAESGGVAQLIVENDRMRFAINVAAAGRARLNLSSRLLSLAAIVKDKP